MMKNTTNTIDITRIARKRAMRSFYAKKQRRIQEMVQLEGVAYARYSSDRQQESSIVVQLA